MILHSLKLETHQFVLKFLHLQCDRPACYLNSTFTLTLVTLWSTYLLFLTLWPQKKAASALGLKKKSKTAMYAIYLSGTTTLCCTNAHWSTKCRSKEDERKRSWAHWSAALLAQLSRHPSGSGRAPSRRLYTSAVVPVAAWLRLYTMV